MPSYIGVGIAWKNSEMSTTAVSFWIENPLPIKEIESSLLAWSLDRWKPEKGWANHSAHITNEISKQEARNLLEHAREHVEILT